MREIKFCDAKCCLHLFDFEVEIVLDGARHGFIKPDRVCRRFLIRRHFSKIDLGSCPNQLIGQGLGAHGAAL